MIKTLPGLCLLAATLAPASLFAHSGAHPVRYVSHKGLDQGHCATPEHPCASIAYAVNQSSKGDEIRIARGQYPASEMDIFFLLSDMVEVRGGYRKDDHFQHQDPDANPTVVRGLPARYRARLAKRGFQLIQDAKGDEHAVDLAQHKFLDRYESITAGKQGPTACNGGLAGEFPCANIDLLSHMPLAEFSSSPSSANDIWGFVDLDDKREYAVIGLRAGTAVVDVTDPGNPVEVGTVAGASSAWRDVKVYQFQDPASGDYRAYAYVTTEGSGGHLQILDLTNLPASVSLANTVSEFARAHNIYLANVDYGTGLALEGREPFLYIAGANKDGGVFRVFSLADPVNPELITIAPVGSEYIHDATSLVIDDSRTAQCHAGHNPCELLIDFNETSVDIWDMTDKTAPVSLSSTPYANAAYTHSGWWSADKRYLFVQDELDEKNLGLNTTLYVLDIGNLTDPVLAGQYTGPTRAIDHNGYAREDRYYMSNYRRGLVVLDISDPAKPAEVGYFDTFPIPEENTPTFNGAWGAYPFLPSGNILVSDIDYGLFVLKETGAGVGAAGDLAFANTTESVTENAGSVDLAVQRTAGNSGEVRVDFATVNGSAEAGSDFEAASGTLIWAAGDSAPKVITVTILDDTTPEAAESFRLSLSNPAGGAKLAANTEVTVTIAASDQAPAPTSGGGGGGGGGGALGGWLALLLILTGLRGQQPDRRLY